MEETGAHLISYQQDFECFLNLELTFDQTNPNPKIGPTPTNSPRKVMQCIGIFKNPILRSWSCRGLQAESSNKRKKLDETWNIAIIEILDFLILCNFENCKFCETWTKMLCSIYHTNLGGE
jgi:hypothetical protein